MPTTTTQKTENKATENKATESKATESKATETCTLEAAAVLIDDATLPSAHVDLALVRMLIPRAQASVILSMAGARRKARSAPVKS